jgi:hypothetical protein
MNLSKWSQICAPIDSILLLVVLSRLLRNARLLISVVAGGSQTHLANAIKGLGFARLSFRHNLSAQARYSLTGYSTEILE